MLARWPVVGTRSNLTPPALAYWPFPTAPAHFWACRSSLNPLREPTQQSDNAARITRVRGVPVRTRGRVQHNPLRAMAEHWLNAARITRVHGFSFWAWQTLLFTRCRWQCHAAQAGLRLFFLEPCSMQQVACKYRAQQALATPPPGHRDHLYRLPVCSAPARHGQPLQASN